MKKAEKHTHNIQAAESETPYFRTFNSQEEAEQFNMVENLKKSDMERFQLYCRMVRIGKMLASAKIVK